MNIIYLDEVKSTNLYLHELLRKDDCEEGTCVRAGFQTAGRGQQGNFWESEAGKNLTCSLVLYPDFLSIMEQFIISQMVSLAIKEVLDQYTENISVKWPNDIYWKEKKIVGILIENSVMGANIEHSIIGIGLNLNQDEFVSDAPNPVSLKQITGREFEINCILHELLNAIYTLYLKLLRGGDEEIRSRYFESLYRKDGYFPFADETNGRFLARIVEVQPTGRISLQTEQGEIREYYFKEVAFEHN